MPIDFRPIEEETGGIDFRPIRPIAEEEPPAPEPTPLKTYRWGASDDATGLLAKQGITGVSPAGRPPLIEDLGAPTPAGEMGISADVPSPPSSAAVARGRVFQKMLGFGPGAEETVVSRMVEPKPTERVADIEPLVDPDKDIPTGDLPTIRPEVLAGETRGPHRAVLEFAGGLTSPKTAALIVGSMGLGQVKRVGQALQKLVSLGFSGDMLYHSVPEFREMKAAADRGEHLIASEHLTKGALSVLFGGLAGKHARVRETGLGPEVDLARAKAGFGERPWGPEPQPPTTPRPSVPAPETVRTAPPPDPTVARAIQEQQLGPAATALPSRLYGLPERPAEVAGPWGELVPPDARIQAARQELGPLAGTIPERVLDPTLPQYRPPRPVERMEPPPIPEELAPRAEMRGPAVERRAAETAPAEPIVDSLQRAGDDALARLRARGEGAPKMAPEAGSAPMIADLADLAVWGAAKFALGMRSKARWLKEMRADVRENLGRKLTKEEAENVWSRSTVFFDRFMRETSDKALVTTRRLTKMYREGKEAGDDWWSASRQEIDRVFGEDAPVFKAFVAIGSWQKPTDINLDLAIRAYNAYKTGRPFEGVRTADGERAFSGQQVKALTAATEGQVWGHGAKSRSMEANLATDLAGPAARKWFSAADEAVTVDRWINRIFGWEKGAKDVPGRPAARYRLMDYAITQAARKAGVAPAQMQAGLWVAIKRAWQETGETKNWTNENFRTLLRERISKVDPLLWEAMEQIPGQRGKAFDTVRLYHWSARPTLERTDPRFYGTGQAGAEMARKAQDPSFPDRTYFTTVPVPPEHRFGPGTGASHLHAADVPAAKLYDLKTDPAGLLGPDLTATENAIRSQGYWGYQVGTDVALFETAKTVGQNLKPVGGRVAFELVPGEGAPYAERFPQLSYDLPYEVSQRVTQDVTRAVVDDLARETGVTVTREGYGPGGYLDYPVVPSGQIKVRGVPDAVGNFIDSIGYLFQQTETIGYRYGKQFRHDAVVLREIGGQSLVDPANAQRYWAKVQEYAPEATGFSPAIDRKYGSGIAIIDLEGKWTPTSARNVERAGRLAGEELGLSIEALRTAADTIKGRNNWNDHPEGQGYRDTLAGRGRRDLVRRLDDHFRPRVETAIEEALRRHAEPRAPRTPEGGLGPEAGALSLPDVEGWFRKLQERRGAKRKAETEEARALLKKAPWLAEKPGVLRANPAIAREVASWKRADQIAKDVEKRVGPDQPVPLEPKLSPRTAKFIAEDVPAATLAGMKHPNVQRVMYQVADMIEFDPRLAEKLPDTYTALRRSGMSELDMAYYLRDVASGAAKTLASFAPLGKELRRIFSDPEAQSVLSEISKVEPPKWNSYRGLMDKFMRLEMIRLASMVSQVKTATRNAYTQAANYTTKIFEDVVDGAVGTARGQEASVAFARAIEDTLALGRAFQRGKERVAGKKGAARGDLDLLMARLPVQAARIAQAPIMDVMLFGKYAKAITALNRAQEMTLRKALFDGSIRAELVKRGFGKELQKSPDRWDIPKDKLAEAAEIAAEETLRVTWGKPFSHGNPIAEIYRKVPLLRLVQPFPRFYFANALRHVYEFSPMSLFSRKTWRDLRAGDTRRATRAVLGTAMLTWATMYRARDDSPGRWYMVKVGDREIDTRPFAPLLSPYLFLGEAILDADRLYSKELFGRNILTRDGEQPRLQSHDLLGAVLGMNRIAGTGLAIVERILSGHGGMDSFTKALREVAGSYVGSFLVPLLQARDVYAEFDPEEQFARDTRGNEFTGPILRNIPEVSQTLPKMPKVTEEGYVRNETPLLSQLTGFLPRETTWISDELSKLGVGWRGIIPQPTGDSDIDRAAKEFMGERIERVLGPMFRGSVYQGADDAQRKEMVTSKIGPLRSWARRRALQEARMRTTETTERRRGAERVVPVGTLPPAPFRDVRPVMAPPPIP